MAKNETQCVFCGEKKKNYQFAKHRNKHLNSDLGFCKDCLNIYAMQSEDIVTDTFRLMNLPFIQDVWENAIELGGDSVFTKYVQLIATKKRYQDFLDSDIFEDDTQKPELESDMDFEVTTEIIERWGSKDSDREYMELELLYKSLCKIKEPTTSLEKGR